MSSLASRIICRKWHRRNFIIEVNPGLFLWCRSMLCLGDLLLLHMRPKKLVVSSSWWNAHFKMNKTKTKRQPISTGLRKMTHKFWKSTTLIPIILSRPDPKRQTSGNRRVPLSGFQFPETQSKARKAYDILTRLKNDTLPFYQIH